MLFFLFSVKPGGDRDVFLSIRDASVPLIYQGPPIMCTFPVFCLLEYHKAATTKQMNLQSGPHPCAMTPPPPPTPTEVCQEADPSHNGGAEDFIEVHMGNACREITPPAPPMYTLGKGVAGPPPRDPFAIYKSPSYRDCV